VQGKEQERRKKTAKETGGGDVQWNVQINVGVLLPLNEPPGGKQILTK
jgi:hypothetical protein